MDTTWGNHRRRWTRGARRSGQSAIVHSSSKLQNDNFHSSSKLQIDSFIHVHSRRNDEEDELMIEPDLMGANRWKKIHTSSFIHDVILLEKLIKPQKLIVSDKTGTS